MVNLYFLGLFFLSVIMFFWSLGVADYYEDLVDMKKSNLLYKNEIKEEYENKQIVFGCFWTSHVIRMIYLFLLVFSPQWFLILLYFFVLFLLAKLPFKRYNKKKFFIFFSVIWFIASIFFIVNHYHIKFFPF